MFYRLASIPEPLFGAFQRLDELDVMTPGQLCNKLLHDFFIRKRLSKGAHIFEVPRRKPRHLGKIAPKIRGEPIDDARAPSFGDLACQDLAADAPVEQDEFLVDSDGRLQASCSDPVLKLRKQRGIPVAVR